MRWNALFLYGVRWCMHAWSSFNFEILSILFILLKSACQLMLTVSDIDIWFMMVHLIAAGSNNVLSSCFVKLLEHYWPSVLVFIGLWLLKVRCIYKYCIDYCEVHLADKCGLHFLRVGNVWLHLSCGPKPVCMMVIPNSSLSRVLLQVFCM